jgi:predicted RNase H-like HicB family nuclease
MYPEQYEHHDHFLEYLLKTDCDGTFVGRVLQLPAVIVQGTTEDEIAAKIGEATLSYIHAFEDDHTRIKKDVSSQLIDSGKGVIIGTKQFKVTC